MKQIFNGNIIRQIIVKGVLRIMNLYEKNQEMRNFFNEKSENYDERHIELGLMDYKTKITEVLNDNTSYILDLGVGTGLELIPFFERFPNAKVMAIDITENMLDILKTREFSNNIEMICEDFFKVDFGQEKFDAVISSAALHHFSKEEKEILYKKIYDSLKDGGQFINSDKFAKDEEEEKRFMQEYVQNTDSEKHIDTPLCLDNEKYLLEKVGFQNIEFQEINSEKYKLMVCRK